MSLRSAAMNSARTPSASIAGTVCAPRSVSRPVMITVAARRANSMAVCRPIPAVAPVTSTRWSCSSMGASFVVRGFVFQTHTLAQPRLAPSRWIVIANPLVQAYSESVRTPRIADPRVCSIEAAMKVIGEKWALRALREITLGQRRFDDIVYNTGAPRDILAARLKSLEAAGVVVRARYAEHPARYEYELSEAGKELFTGPAPSRGRGVRYGPGHPENIRECLPSCR